MDAQIIEPFTIESLGWTFTDSRSEGELELKTFHEAWTFHMSRIFVPRGVEIKDYICGHHEIDEDVIRFVEARESDPGLTYDDYRNQDNRLRHTDLDGSRPQYFLCASDGDNPIGGITITNIDMEDQNDMSVNVAGIMALGVPYDGNCGPTWTTVYDHLINTPLLMTDGRFINFVQYECTYLNPPDPEFDEFLGLLGQMTEVIGEIDNALPGPQHVLVRRPA
jgi:hypothetical protein